MRACCVLFTWHEGVDCLCTDRFGGMFGSLFPEEEQVHTLSQCGPLYENSARSVSVSAPVYCSDQISTPEKTAVPTHTCPFGHKYSASQVSESSPLAFAAGSQHEQCKEGPLFLHPPTCQFSGSLHRNDFSSLLQQNVRKTGFPGTTPVFSPGRPHAWLLCPLPSSSPFPSPSLFLSLSPFLPPFSLNCLLLKL